MQISYGPPAARGVTQLMAVGDADFVETATDRAVRRGGWLAIAALGVACMVGSRRAQAAAAGAAVALFAVRAVSRRGAVEVATTPAPAGWYR